jgi:outer membrane protein OmpA-like peptidoglycan-associated protein
MGPIRIACAAAALTAILGLGFATACQAADAVIFFPYQHVDGGRDGDHVVQGAAKEIIAGGVTNVTVKGHCSLYETLIDDAGNDAAPGYCDALALKRAQAVRDKLYAAGVPASVRIDAVSVGFNEPRDPEPITDQTRANLADKDNRDMLPGGDPMNRSVDILY